MLNKIKWRKKLKQCSALQFIKSSKYRPAVFFSCFDIKISLDSPRSFLPSPCMVATANVKGRSTYCRNCSCKWFKLFHRFTYNGFILVSFHARHGLIAQKLNFRCVCVWWSLRLYKIKLLIRSVTMEATLLKQQNSTFVL